MSTVYCVCDARFYHPDRAFHMEFQWLVATASQINDLLERWRRRVVSDCSMTNLCVDIY
eukprot:m.228213 g.228213  ORF g.228213 m.228213 type:complete len:59 (-) comp15189_c1_seq3:204-380(-)